MKKLLLTVIIITLELFACTSPKRTSFTIKGNVKGLSKGKVFLQKKQEGKFVTLDSTDLKQGQFSFKGKVDLPEMYFIIIPKGKSIIPFFIENSDMNFKVYIDSLDQSTIKGSQTQQEYESFLDKSDNYNNKIHNIFLKYKEAKKVHNKTLMDSLISAIDSLYKNKREFIKKYVLKNNKTVVSPYLALTNAYQFNLKELDSITNNFDKSLEGSIYVKNLRERIKILQRVSVGHPAVDFTLNDTTGNPVSLSSFKGKYLFIDFWASWCKPCRFKNPNLLALYKKYKNKGFDIIGVSFDTKKDAWEKAIKEDKLSWTQVSDIKGWENLAGRLYGIRKIPQNVLLDKDGIIIAKNLKIKDLEKKLKSIFK